MSAGLRDLDREACGPEREPRDKHSRDEQAVEALRVFSSHASSSTSTWSCAPGHWCVTPPVPPRATATDCWIAVKTSIIYRRAASCLRVLPSWLLVSDPSNCSSHLCIFDLLCRSWCALNITVFFHSLFHIQTKLSVLMAGNYILLAEEYQSYLCVFPPAAPECHPHAPFSKGWLSFQAAGILVWSLLYYGQGETKGLSENQKDVSSFITF